jgi:Ca2+-transporting ATPase
MMGSIAGSLAVSPPTPLESELREASGRIATAGLAVGALLVVLTFVRSGRDWEAFLDGLLAGVALAVAAIPEGLLAVVTMGLALGAQRMARRKAIVRHLPAIEALGSVSVLCTDKTGTLTTGQLFVAQSEALPGREDDLWAAAIRCNDAVDEQGDPLDVALLREAGRLGIEEPQGTRIAEIPFDPRNGAMTTVHQTDEGPVLSLKGAPEVVLARCAPGADTDFLRQTVDQIAAAGQRVLAFADGRSSDLAANGLRALGLVAFADPLRPSARATIADCRRAGIDLVLVTGDHLATAQTIARAVGMEAEPEVVGKELAAMSPAERKRALATARVVARVQPDMKVELVEALRSQGRVVGMTGDGVNDAPALQRADVGVALAGARGSDVAREAADIVVTDDDLATVVEAVREGRVIYRNATSVIRYLLTGNVSEIIVVLVGLALFPELTVPLLPMQILWVNLVTDGLPAIALAVDRPPIDPLLAPPRDVADRLLTLNRQARLAVGGSVVGAVVLASTFISKELGWDDEQVRTQLLLSLVCCHLSLAYVSRSERLTFASGWSENRLLLLAIVGSAVLQAVMVLTGPGRTFLSLEPLPAGGWLIALGAAVVSVLLLDLQKFMHDRNYENRISV